MSKAGKTWGIFSLVYFHAHTCSVLHLHERGQCMIPDDEWVCRDCDHKYEVVSMEMFCPVPGVDNLEWRVFCSLPSCSLIEFDPRSYFWGRHWALCPVLEEYLNYDWALELRGSFLKQSLYIWVGVLQHLKICFKIPSLCLPLCCDFTFQAVFPCSKLGK